MPLTPAIRSIVMHARKAREGGGGVTASDVLDAVAAHAHSFGNRLEFEDAVELINLFEGVEE